MYRSNIVIYISFFLAVFIGLSATCSADIIKLKCRTADGAKLSVVSVDSDKKEVSIEITARLSNGEIHISAVWSHGRTGSFVMSARGIAFNPRDQSTIDQAMAMLLEERKDHKNDKQIVSVKRNIIEFGINDSQGNGYNTINMVRKELIKYGGEKEACDKSS